MEEDGLPLPPRERVSPKATGEGGAPLIEFPPHPSLREAQRHLLPQGEKEGREVAGRIAPLLLD